MKRQKRWIRPIDSRIAELSCSNVGYLYDILTFEHSEKEFNMLSDKIDKWFYKSSKSYIKKSLSVETYRKEVGDIRIHIENINLHTINKLKVYPDKYIKRTNEEVYTLSKMIMKQVSYDLAKNKYKINIKDYLE
jgi:hypothetical protein